MLRMPARALPTRDCAIPYRRKRRFFTSKSHCRPSRSKRSFRCHSYQTEPPFYFSCIRIAPSKRMTQPFKRGFSTICCTSFAYSSGCPKRFGKGICSAKLCWTASGIARSIGVPIMPGAIVTTRIPNFDSSRGRRQCHRHHSAFRSAVSCLSDLAFVRRNRSGINNNASLTVVVDRLARRQSMRSQAQHIEGAE